MENYNASPSSFGWNFQINATIIFLIDNIRSIEEIRVEGEHEDIELFLNNSSRVFIQTKSYTKSGTDANALSKLKDGLRTLFEASKRAKYDKLYYVTNYPNPLGGRQSQYNIFMGGFYIERAYKELSEEVKTPINKVITGIEGRQSKHFDTDNFIIAVIPFDGDIRATRERVILEKIKEFLTKLKINTGLSKELLEIWQSELFFNSSQIRTSLTLKKRALMWPIVVLNCEVNRYDKLLDELEDEFYLENEDIEIVIESYKDFIDKKSEQFDFVSKVLGDFQLYRLENKGESRKSKIFIKKKWKNYIEELYSDDMEEELLEVLVKVILTKVLDNKRIISKISKGANL